MRNMFFSQGVARFHSEPEPLLVGKGGALEAELGQNASFYQADATRPSELRSPDEFRR